MYSPSAIDALILVAARNGDLEELKEVKEKIGDEDFRKRCDLASGHGGRRVLHYAALTGMIQMCKFLIEEVKVEIDIRSDRGDTPLLYAVLVEHVNIAKYLIDHGAEIATSNSEGYTSLHYAATQKDSKELMQLLLMKGADIEANSVCGTPLQFAAACGSVEAVRFLLDHGAKPNSVCLLFGSPLVCAIMSDSSECVKLLLKAGADPNKISYGFSPLARAAAGGETEILKSLLAAGANPNSFTIGLRPLELAASALNRDGVRILLPVTKRIPNYPDWSINGIMKYFHSKEAKITREQMMTDCLNSMDQNGKDAWRRQDYTSAVKWFSEAIFLDPSNAKMISNRSLCWAHLGEAAFALYDAEECVRLRPDWAKAHYREGAAWKLLRNYRMSASAFEKARSLDPQNEEIKTAYREAFATLLLDMAANYPLEVLSLSQLPWMG